MGPRRVLVLVMGVVAAGATAMYAKNILDSRPAVVASTAQPAQQPDQVHRILVAEAVLPAGRFIKEQDLRWQDWPTDDVPDFYILDGRQTMDTVIGAVVRHGI